MFIPHYRSLLSIRTSSWITALILAAIFSTGVTSVYAQGEGTSARGLGSGTSSHPATGAKDTGAKDFVVYAWLAAAVVVAMIAAIRKLRAPAVPVVVQPNKLSIMVGTRSSSPPDLLEPTRDVGPEGPDAAGEELDMLIDDYLRTAGNTAIQYLDETDFRKVGSGMAEALNQLDALEAGAQQGKLSNADAQAGILNAYKQLGLDVVRAANLVALLKALAGLGLAGIRAARRRLIGQTKTAIQAGLSTEKEVLDEIVKRGGKNLNDLEKVEKELSRKGIKVKIRPRGGNGAFPIFDAIDESGKYVSVATSGQRSLGYLRGKFKIAFEGAGNKSTQDAARKWLSAITGNQVTELSLQANARLIVNGARIEEMQAFVRERIRDFYITGEAQSAFATHLIDFLTKKGFKGEAVVHGVTSEFLKRVVPH
jgi:hypothetical protein